MNNPGHNVPDTLESAGKLDSSDLPDYTDGVLSVRLRTRLSELRGRVMSACAQFSRLILIGACGFFTLVPAFAAELGMPIEPESETVKKIQAALKQPVTIKVDQQPARLADVVRVIAETCNIPVELDRFVLGKVLVIFPDTEVNVPSPHLPLRSLLGLPFTPC